jgi:hypothetical protein
LTTDSWAKPLYREREPIIKIVFRGTKKKVICRKMVKKSCYEKV